MSCWTRQRVTIELAVADRALLVQALTAEGFRPHVATSYIEFLYGGYLHAIIDGKLTGVDADEVLAKRIKRAYAKESVKHAAKQNGWGYTENAQGKIQLTKGGGW